VTGPFSGHTSALQNEELVPEASLLTQNRVGQDQLLREILQKQEQEEAVTRIRAQTQLLDQRMEEVFTAERQRQEDEANEEAEVIQRMLLLIGTEESREMAVLSEPTNSMAQPQTRRGSLDGMVRSVEVTLAPPVDTAVLRVSVAGTSERSVAATEPKGTGGLRVCLARPVVSSTVTVEEEEHEEIDLVGGGPPSVPTTSVDLSRPVTKQRAGQDGSESAEDSGSDMDDLTTAARLKKKEQRRAKKDRRQVAKTAATEAVKQAQDAQQQLDAQLASEEAETVRAARQEQALRRVLASGASFADGRAAEIEAAAVRISARMARLAREQRTL
jgi:hypothetical protein